MIAQFGLILSLIAIVIFARPKATPNNLLPDRAFTASNLHQIGLAITIFCSNHGGRYPDSLTDLMADTPLTPAVIVSPASNDSVAVMPSTTPTTQQAAAALVGNDSFVYLGRV